jgi:CHAD domain-containing protein
MPIDRAASTILRGLFEAALAEAPAVLHGDDVEATHDMRVAIRRLRSALETFEDTRPSRKLGTQPRAIRRLRRKLGRVRDADVHLAVLRGAFGGATVSEAPGITFALESIAAERRRALSDFAVELSQFNRTAFLAALDDDAR